ncbi:hypothetical protein, partial [Leptospira noguchii]
MSYPHPKRWKLKHNAFLNSMHRSLRVALQGRVGNSTQRFPELNASLPKGRVGNSTQRFPKGRVGNSAQRFPMGRVGNS